MLLQEIIYHTNHNGQVQKYIKKQKIGSGGFAKCYLIMNPKTQQKYAAKIIDYKEIKQKSNKNKITQEIEIHKTLNHPNIVKFYHHFEYQQHIYMIIELCQNNTLKQFIKNRVRITQFEAKVYMHQIISGIEYLHQRNIIHRDIKLGNLFLNIKMQVKIGDFGLSRELKQIKQRRFTTCGTPNYIAPEILKQTGHSFEADIWAIGIVLYAMLVGKPPFESDSVENTYRKIKNNIFEFPKQVPLSNQAKNLIKCILDPNPKTRFTIQQIKKHQFMNKDTQSLPQSMPSYTISIPPQRQFLKQFVNQKNMRLLVYPKKIYDTNGQYQTDDRISKLSRVQSLDKKILLKFEKINQEKQISSLNRGRYIKALKLNNLSKSSLKNLKGVRSATSIGSTIKKLYPETERNIINSPIKKTIDDDLNQIICYYDLSQKYGIGYLLSNGNHGVIFNDQTSLTAVQNLEETQQNQSLNYIYYEKHPQLLTEIPQRLIKKHEILKICNKQLQNYRKTNIFIAYKSQTFVKKWIRLQTGFVMKLNNGIMQFFWDADSIALRNYKWVRWRINQREGQGQIGQQNFPDFVNQKVEIVKNFLLKNCSKSKAKS